MNVPTKYTVRALSIHGIIGVAKNFGQFLPMPTLSIPPNPISLPYRLFMCTRFNAISDWSFGWGLETSNLREVDRRGSGMVPTERALVSSYWPSIMTFPHLKRFRYIAVMYRQHATFSMGVGGWPLGYEERMRWADCSCN